MSIYQKLNIGRQVMMELTINGEVHESAKLEFYGYVGEENSWLHFVNTRTHENHLIKEEQFPACVFKMGRENICKLQYFL